MRLFQFFSRYVRGLFLVLLAILFQLDFLSIRLVDARVIIGFSTFLALHSLNNSSSFFLFHSSKTCTDLFLFLIDVNSSFSSSSLSPCCIPLIFYLFPPSRLSCVHGKWFPCTISCTIPCTCLCMYVQCLHIDCTYLFFVHFYLFSTALLFSPLYRNNQPF